MGTSDLTSDAATKGAAPLLPAPPRRLPRPALFLDMDGVLAPLAETPDAVVPDARRTAVLRGLSDRLHGRVAIISGRTIAEIDRIAESAAASASGVHGLERRRADGSLEQAKADPAVRDAVAAFHQFARTRPGIIVEDKAVSAGLHYRQARGEAGAVGALAERLAEQSGPDAAGRTSGGRAEDTGDGQGHGPDRLHGRGPVQGGRARDAGRRPD